MRRSLRRYPRTELARSTADVIEGRGLFDEGRDGLFLAAPRRTGKTTFLVEDLRPEMLERGHTVVYVDLWQNLKADPADVIDGAIGKAVRERLGGVAKATLAAGVESLDIAGVMKIDTTRIGKHDGASLAEALAALREVSSGSIVLMVKFTIPRSVLAAARSPRASAEEMAVQNSPCRLAIVISCTSSASWSIPSSPIRLVVAQASCTT